MADNQKNQNQSQGQGRQQQGNQGFPDQGSQRQNPNRPDEQGDTFATQADGERTQGMDRDDNDLDQPGNQRIREKEQQGTQFNQGQSKPGQGGNR